MSSDCGVGSFSESVRLTESEIRFPKQQQVNNNLQFQLRRLVRYMETVFFY